MVRDIVFIFFLNCKCLSNSVFANNQGFGTIPRLRLARLDNVQIGKPIHSLYLLFMSRSNIINRMMYNTALLIISSIQERCMSVALEVIAGRLEM